MKWWNLFLIALLCAFIAVGYCDIGFGSDVIIEEVENEPEVDDGIEIDNLIPIVTKEQLYGRSDGHEIVMEDSETNSIAIIPVNPPIEANGHVLPDQQPEIDFVTEASEAIHDDRSTLVNVTLSKIDGTVEMSNSVDNNNGSSELSTAINIAANENYELPLQDIVVSESTNERVIEKNVLSLSSVVSPEAPAKDIDPVSVIGSELSLGGSMEALLNQLDEANQEIATLTAANAALKASLNTASNEARTLSDEVNALRGKLAAMYTALTAVQSESQAKANVSSDEWNKLTNKHAQEVQILTDKLAVAERNATTLEIRVRLEKNEKTIARLSTDNCMMELEAARHLQQDELAELKNEITALKKLDDAKCSSAAGTSAALPIAARAATTPPVAAAKHVSSSECDASQCMDSLLSKYIFFWAAEHRSQGSSSTQPNLPRSASHAASQGTAPAGKLGHNDAYLDKVGDEEQGESAPVILWKRLQQGASTAWAALATHVVPLAFRLLKYEFQVAVAVVKAGYQAAVWLWGSVLSPIFFSVVLPTAQNAYYTQILPFVNSTVYPWYKANLEESVNARVALASAHWIEHYDEWFGYHIADPFEFVVGRLYVAGYFVEKFFTSDDLVEQLEHAGQYMTGFVPSVIHQLSSIDALQGYFGDHCVMAVSVLVYSSLGMLVYIMRRVILGIVAFVAVILLSPLLLAVYVFAKVVALLRPRKKSKRVMNGRPSRSANSGQASRDRDGGGRRDGAGHAAQPSQLATRQLPIDIPVTGAAPLGRVSGRNIGASALGAVDRPAQSGRTGGPAPPLSKHTSGLPPRQGYPRGDLMQSGSGSNSGESLSNLGAPPLSAWSSVDPDV